MSAWRWKWWAMWTVAMAMAAHVAQSQETPVMGLCGREPDVRVDCYPPVPNFPNATEETCRAQGCCWKPLDNEGIPCAFGALGTPDSAQCAKVSQASRLACRNPRFADDRVVGGDVHTCHAIGCCYDEDQAVCFQPFFEGYELLTLEETPRGWRGTLVLRRFLRGPFGNDVSLLELHVIKESASRVRVRITDPSFPRYEVPESHDRNGDQEHSDSRSSSDQRSRSEKVEDDGQRPSASDYHVHFYERPFGIAVTRRNTHEVLFNSTPATHATTSFNGLVFENQFLEISTHLECNDALDAPVLFGLGERWGPVRLRADRKGDHYPMFSRRAHNITPHTRDGGDNLGSVHPFYLQVLSSGRSHGVFFRSSNAMEVVTQEDALTFRTTGGVLDFIVFSGPSAMHVASEYTEVVGRPEMPPFWALGYHFGKEGQDSLNDVMNQVNALRTAGIPLDAYWQDADIMYDHEAFSLNERYFPLEETRGFVDDLHFNNQYYVVFMSPAIPTAPDSQNVDHARVIGGEEAKNDDESGSGEVVANAQVRSWYYPLARGMELNVFLKGIEGEPYAEKMVSSRWSAFVDFSNPNATAYWLDMLAQFHQQLLPFDGVWVNGNEPSSSCDTMLSGTDHLCDDGTEGTDGSRGDESMWAVEKNDEVEYRDTPIGGGGFIRTQDVAFPFDPYRQPFVPGQTTFARGGHGNLNAATLPMAALHGTSLHYNLHSLYGHQQAKITRYALNQVIERRSIAMSRSTFAGDGRYAGQLNGDVDATWENMRLSIASVIQTSLLGIPFSGPSVGGNGRGMTKELSIRWNQAASFFPLFRNHVSRSADPQSPIDFDQETANIVREVSRHRYSYLAYLYTQFYHAHAHGHTVIRALALEFPEDQVAVGVETQYLVGPAIMVSPVVEERSISVHAYFPNATWYDLKSGRMIISSMKDAETFSNRYMTMLTPLSKLQVHIRGGYIVPTQEPSSTTAMTKRAVYRLIIALNPSEDDARAEGELFIDDGDSLHSVQDGRYSLLTFEARHVHDNMLEVVSKRVFHGYDGPEMYVDLEKIMVFGLRGKFLANSSLHLHGSIQVDSMKVEYFEHADMLVMTQVKVPIGEELRIRVEARNAEAKKPIEDDDEAGVDSSGDREGQAGRNEGGERGRDEAEAHGGKEHSRGSEHGRPHPIKSEQHSRKAMPWYMWVLIVAGVGAVAAVVYVVIRRQRRGYNPIT